LLQGRSPGIGPLPLPSGASAPLSLPQALAVLRASPKKLQNVMEVTEHLALAQHQKEITVILALACAITAGMALTTAFAFSVLPLNF